MRFRGIDTLADLVDRAKEDDLHVPEHEREGVARDVLDKLGIRVSSESAAGALRFSCPLPLGQHSGADAKPSAALMMRTLRYRCFVCGGGSLVWFVATMLDQSEVQAKAWLRSEGTLDFDGVENILQAIEEIARGETWEQDHLPHYNPRILEPWKIIHPYITEKRKVPEQTVVDCQVGYMSDRQRIVIPHFWKGELIGWVSRRILSDGTPKYKNTPDFPRDRTLYLLREDKPSRALVVESPMSVLRHRHHMEPEINMVGTFGAEVTKTQCKHLRDFGEVTVWQDPDVAGEGSTVALSDMLDGYGNLFVVPNPYDVDPADLTDDDFLRLYDERIPYVLWERPGDAQYRGRQRRGDMTTVRTYVPYGG